MRQICATLLSVLRAVMVICIVIIILGIIVVAVFGTIGIILIVSSSTPVTIPVLIVGLFSLPIIGKFLAVGVVMIMFGGVILIVAAALYGLVYLSCSLVPGGMAGLTGSAPSGFRDPKDSPPGHIQGEEILCLIAPFFPAGMVLLLAVPLVPLLFFLLGGAGLTLGSPGVSTLIIALVVLLCFIGLLLALVPYVWCCCKCRKRVDAASLLDPVLDALESTAAAVETAGGAIGNVKTAFDTAGEKLKEAGQTIGDFKIPVPVQPSTDLLSHFGVPAAPGHVKILTGDFGSEDRRPAGAAAAKIFLDDSGQALKDKSALLGDVQSRHNAAALALRRVAAVLRSLTA